MMYSTLKFWCKKIVGSVPGRLVILFLAAGGGYFLSKRGFPLLDCWLEFSDRVDYYLEPLLFGLPVFICLWCFRTYDTQQQIQQGNFVTGMNKLVQDNPAVITIGVKILLQVSAKTNSFDDEIRDAFTNCLKKKLETPDRAKVREIASGNIMESFAPDVPHRFTYAQYILQWLIAKQKHYKEKPYLRGMRCDYQEFKVPGLDLVKVLPTPDEVQSELPNNHFMLVDEAVHWVVSFAEADCETLNFDGVAPDILILDDAINTMGGKQ